MFINWQMRELNLKIVYYGPGMSGKTTNLELIHERANPNRRSDLVSLKTKNDRTLYFDFLQLELGTIRGMTPKLHVYTVPGQTYYAASRKLVLRGADGVVFVADSSPDRLRDNIESWRSMQTQLAELDIQFDSLPLVYQFNKRDNPKAIPVDIMKRMLQVNGQPTFEAVAFQGQGVFSTFKSIINLVLSHISQQIA